MAFAMTALTRLPSGAYAARKGIPKDVQEEYFRGVAHTELSPTRFKDFWRI